MTATRQGEAGSLRSDELDEAKLARARAGDEEAFRELTGPIRRELQVHCYRILGSVQDAEDLVQETLLAAWRGLEGFEGRASVRSWLYRIATNRCLNALRDRTRRPQEVPSMVEPPEPTRRAEPIWLEPYPDSLLEGLADPVLAPDARYEARESVGIAFMAALQLLPLRQRAALVLRDVLGFRTTDGCRRIQSRQLRSPRRSGSARSSAWRPARSRRSGRYYSRAASCTRRRWFRWWRTRGCASPRSCLRSSADMCGETRCSSSNATSTAELSVARRCAASIRERSISSIPSVVTCASTCSLTESAKDSSSHVGTATRGVSTTTRTGAGARGIRRAPRPGSRACRRTTSATPSPRFRFEPACRSRSWPSRWATRRR